MLADQYWAIMFLGGENRSGCHDKGRHAAGRNMSSLRIVPWGIDVRIAESAFVCLSVEMIVPLVVGGVFYNLAGL